MYTASLFLGVQNAGGIQPVISIEQTVYYRERAAGMYSALPYALAQVLEKCHTLSISCITYYNSNAICTCSKVYFQCLTGYNWVPIYFFTIFDVLHHSICNDGIWMVFCQGSLVFLLHVLHFPLLHLLWHVIHRCHAELPRQYDYLDCVLRDVEHLLWLYHP